jgi:hypothetical protein
MVTNIKGRREIVYRRSRVVVGDERLLWGSHRAMQKRQTQIALRGKNVKRNE